MVAYCSLWLPAEQFVGLAVDAAAENQLEEDLLGHEAGLAVVLRALFLESGSEGCDELLHRDTVRTGRKSVDNLPHGGRVDILGEVGGFWLVGGSCARGTGSGGLARLGRSGTTGSRPDWGGLRLSGYQRSVLLFLLPACAIGHLARCAFTIASSASTSATTRVGSVAAASWGRSAGASLLLLAS